jgi:adenylate cyclase
VQCAVEVQDAIGRENTDRPVGEQMRFRIGIHVGDIMVQGDNLCGDAVPSMSRSRHGGACGAGRDLHLAGGA